MTSAEDYESMANAVYFVDPLRQKPPRAVNETFYSDNDSRKQQWVVVNVSADASDGFQAMAVAPVMNGVRDDSRIFIAYAGTNPEDPHDLANDLGVGLSAKPAQASDAMAFAATVKKLHPTSKFETVGHSLGGYLAQYVAAENRWPATSFNGPDAWRIMSSSARAWLDKHNAAGTNPLKNYVNRFDTVGNSKGNRSGAGIFVDDVPRRPLLDYHNLGKNKKGKPNGFRFDASGNIVGTGAKQLDFGIILYNLGLTGAAKGVWRMDKSSPYPKVLVAIQPAIELADRIDGLTAKLRAIRSANNGVEEKLQEALDEAKSEYPAFHPYVSHTDVENCVAAHGLEVHHSLDRDAVESVNRLVDHQLRMVESLHRGIRNAVVNALTQDARSAQTFRAG